MPKFIVQSVQDRLITLHVPDRNYANTFTLPKDIPAPAPGARLRGAIHAPAWKIDRVELGGNYVEPLQGRPRRMQGTILFVNAAANELTVQVGYEAVVKLPSGKKAAEFQVGQRIGWDNVEIPTFKPEPAAAPAA